MESADSRNVTELNCEGDECKIPLLRKMLEEISNPGALPAFNPKEAADKARAIGAELSETVLEAVMALRDRRRRLGADDSGVGATVELKADGSGLKCVQCHRVYPVRDDIPVMLVDEAKIEE